jgi:serine/threonine protein kinase
MQVLHRDLKSFNLLLFDNWRLKISDFGVSKMLVTQHTNCGTTAAAGSTGTIQVSSNPLSARSSVPEALQLLLHVIVLLLYAVL